MSDKSFRNIKQKVKTAKGRKISSTKWLERHFNDQYVLKAKRNGYRSRAAFKLIEIDYKFSIFKGAKKIIDLGCAPGGWLQVARERVKDSPKLIGVDLQSMRPIDKCNILTADFTDVNTVDAIIQILDGKADIIMSDMAANSCGEPSVDHLRVVYLVELALEFAYQNLNEGGSFIAKMLKGGEETKLITEIKKRFRSVHYFKPDASYDDSSEIYIVALGFKGQMMQ